MKPENYPKIIYKYRNWDDANHKNILLKNHVYLASPKDFNDPFDFRIAKNYHLLDTPEKKENFANASIEKYRDILLISGRNIEDEKRILKDKLQDIDQYQKENEEFRFREMDKHYGVLSLSGRWDSILMWSHYSNFHRGFNIGYDEEKMRESGLFGKGGPVSYSDSFPMLDPSIQHSMEVSFQQTHHKAKEWEYEQEYRLAKLYFPKEPTKQDRTIEIPEEYIEEINLGISISEKDRVEITKIAIERGIKIFQLEKIAFKFKLDRKEITAYNSLMAQ